jgi:hypothetical protein
VARAMDDGLELAAFSAEYIAHILAARQRIGAEPAALLSMAIEFSPPVVIQISPPGWESVLSAGRSSPALSFSLSR